MAPLPTLNFAWFCWNRKSFTLNLPQQAVVRALWLAWRAGRPCVPEAELTALAGHTGPLETLFARSLAWGNLIARGAVRDGPPGTFCLMPSFAEARRM